MKRRELTSAERRDALAVVGLVFICIGVFLESVTLGLVITGLAFMVIAFLKAWESSE
jgi:hypothetical protein